MSFILEALKKSEQQRQQQESSPQKKRKRTISLQSQQSDRRLLYWALAGALSLTLFGGWWFYGKAAATHEQPPAMDRTMNAPSAQNPPASPEVSVASPAVASPAVASPSVASAPQQTAVAATSPTKPIEPSAGAVTPVQTALAAEPAPVPSVYAAAPSRPVKKASAKRAKPAVEVQRDKPVAEEFLATDEQVATASTEQTQLRALGERPLYQDLSKGLRDRMPPMSMSMHFYNKDPNRRLVRINDRLLHEGDWVDRDLQLVEITVSGATLEFLGKTFILPSNRR
jgi:general secretion pathway protein B